MPSTAELVLQTATPDQEPVVREVLRAARLLWQCRHHPCGHDNPQAARLCERCGRQRNGRRIADIVPFSAEDDAFEALRQALKEHFADTGQPRPHAVTFDMNFEREWRSHNATLHFAARTETAALGASVGEALDDLGPAEGYDEELRVALYL
ncbi:hypothetical protein PV726_32010 [Streptomyces europaeiscabiei]|uniref:hypothetical protein n=1 Tax=Streptomyces europaeiscabiei TaxID=146819 RepID=UPI0029BCFEA0|nr:hypothetical protein [Streptomyces europaeiscabiei]MDX3694881.1 hypothetical protein [Streptomyces europaeiscabiei]